MIAQNLHRMDPEQLRQLARSLMAEVAERSATVELNEHELAFKQATIEKLTHEMAVLVPTKLPTQPDICIAELRPHLWAKPI